jgi:ubiquinone/menaquinone biosynthesis C-methylase UbiE
VTALDKLKNEWDNLAEQDPLWAILTDSTKTGRKWDVANFMATGDAEIATVMGHLARIGYIPNCNGTALDFGCGVGRLTQALAQRFASCVGIDISQQMIHQAQSFNRHPNCRYVANSDARLPFEHESFSFIYSNIVLQHVPQLFSEQYLREFIRVLTEDGVLVFGVQDSFSAGLLSSLLIRIRRTLRIRFRIKVALGLSVGDMQMHCLAESVIRSALGSAKVVDIQFTNTAANDFNGKLVYLTQAPSSGYIGKQYCVVKRP